MYLHVIVTYVSDRYIFPIADTDAGFIHSLSPLKRARNGRDYYNFTLQTSPTKFTKVIGFDKKSHTQAQHFHTAGSPAKLLNINDKQGDIFVNQTSSIVQASSSNVHFESSEPTSQDDHKFSDATDVNLKELNDLSRNQKVNVTGVLTLGDKPPKEVIKRNGEKGLTKEDCVIEDLTGVATIHIWDHLLTKLTSGKGYKFENLTVKNYSGTTLLGTAPVTTYEETNLELESTKGPELLSNTERDLTVAEFNFVDKVNIFMTCQLKTCNKRMPHALGSTVFKCHACGATQKVKSAKKAMSAKLSTDIDGQAVWLTAFTDAVQILMKKANLADSATTDEIAAGLFELENIALKINTQSKHIISVSES